MLVQIMIFAGLAAGAVFALNRITARLCIKEVPDEELSQAEEALLDKVHELQKLELELELSDKLGQNRESLKNLTERIVQTINEIERASTAGKPD